MYRSGDSRRDERVAGLSFINVLYHRKNHASTGFVIHDTCVARPHPFLGGGVATASVATLCRADRAR
jgi:hypothetical protein